MWEVFIEWPSLLNDLSSVLSILMWPLGQQLPRFLPESEPIKAYHMP